jgi:hypothetical protein
VISFLFTEIYAIFHLKSANRNGISSTGKKTATQVIQISQIHILLTRLKLNFLWGICNVTNFNDCIYLRLYFTEKVLLLGIESMPYSRRLGSAGKLDCHDIYLITVFGAPDRWPPKFSPLL